MQGKEVGAQQIAPLVLGGPGGNNLAELNLETRRMLMGRSLSGWTPRQQL